LSSVFSRFSSGRFSLKFFQGLTNLFLYVFFARLLFRNCASSFSTRCTSSISRSASCNRSRLWGFFAYAASLARSGLFIVRFYFLLLFWLFELGKIYGLTCKTRTFKFSILGGNRFRLFWSFCFYWSFSFYHLFCDWGFFYFFRRLLFLLYLFLFLLLWLFYYRFGWCLNRSF